MTDIKKLRELAETKPDTIRLKASGIVKLLDEIDRLKRTQFILGQCIHNLVVAEQAAWIEWQHGAGAEEAMTWIHNGLAGPGHIPKHEGQSAQEYFDANQDDRMEPSAPRPRTENDQKARATANEDAS